MKKMGRNYIFAHKLSAWSDRSHSKGLAMTSASIASPANFRGFRSVRAEGSQSPAALVEQIHTAFTAFRTRNDSRLDAIEQAVNSMAEGGAAALALGGGIHPAAGIRAGGQRFAPISGNVADSFHAQLLGAPNAGMRTGSDPDGGFTVDRQVDNVLDTVLRDLSPLRSLARVVSLTTGNSWEKILGKSGAQSYWAGEEDTRNETGSPTLGKIEIAPGEVYAIPSLTNHVLEDSMFDLNGFLAEDVAGEFALAEGAAFISGNGINKPRGFLTYAAVTAADTGRDFGKLQYLPTGTSGAFAASNPADILCDLVTSLRASYRAGDGVAWLMNSATANVVRKFKDGQGNYLWTPSIIAGQPDRLLGYPVAIDEGMPDIAANSVSIVFGNWRRGYAIVDKPGLRLIVDKVTRKGWTLLYFSRRVGGGLVDSNALKLLKFSAS